MAAVKRKKLRGVFLRINSYLVYNYRIFFLLLLCFQFCLAVKASVYSGEYCKEEVKWRSSSNCNNLGIMLVTSCEASVGTMVVLTTYRLFAVTNPWKVKELRTELVLAWIILVWLVAVVIAVIPTADSIRDLFVTSAVVARGRNKLGLLYFQSGTITKISLMDFLQRACMLVFSATLPNFQEDCASLSERKASWNGLHSLTDKLFPGMLTGAEIGYYGQHGVCIPALYPQSFDRDPSKTSTRNYTAVIVTINFVSFVYVSMAYAVIWYKSAPTKKISYPKNSEYGGNPGKTSPEEKRARNIHKRIARIILTDFFCWVPICLITFCGLSGAVTIPTWMYSFTAVVLLPINSALNPIIYSDIAQTLFKTVKDKFHFKVTKKLRRRKGSYSFRSERVNSFSQTRRVSLRTELQLDPQEKKSGSILSQTNACTSQRINSATLFFKFSDGSRGLSPTPTSQIDAAHSTQARELQLSSTHTATNVALLHHYSTAL